MLGWDPTWLTVLPSHPLLLLLLSLGAGFLSAPSSSSSSSECEAPMERRRGGLPWWQQPSSSSARLPQLWEGGVTRRLNGCCWWLIEDQPIIDRRSRSFDNRLPTTNSHFHHDQEGERMAKLNQLRWWGVGELKNSTRIKRIKNNLFLAHFNYKEHDWGELMWKVKTEEQLYNLDNLSAYGGWSRDWQRKILFVWEILQLWTSSLCS